MPRKLRSDSPSAQVLAFATVGAEIRPPAGIELETDEERELWRQITAARDPNSWRAADLMMAAKLVRLELDIRRLSVELADQRHVITDPIGRQVENPLVATIDKLQRQQLSIARLIGLYQGAGGSGAAQANRRGREGEILAERVKGAPSLLAT